MHSGPLANDPTIIIDTKKLDYLKQKLTEAKQNHDCYL